MRYPSFDATPSARAASACLWTGLWVFVLLMAFPHDAMASCGDYLLHPDAATPVQATLPVEEQTVPRPLKAPCDGPSCRRGPCQTPLPTPIHTDDTDERCLVFIAPNDLVLEDSRWRSRREFKFFAPVFCSRLERPPKFTVGTHHCDAILSGGERNDC